MPPKMKLKVSKKVFGAVKVLLKNSTVRAVAKDVGLSTATVSRIKRAKTYQSYHKKMVTANKVRKSETKNQIGMTIRRAIENLFELIELQGEINKATGKVMDNLNKKMERAVLRVTVAVMVFVLFTCVMFGYVLYRLSL
jgi:DNA-binding MurR/RpiR family transcriptional regulator